MNCIHCGAKMSTAKVFDDPELGVAFNLKMCDGCGTICKEDVWKGKGQTWIATDNTITRVFPQDTKK